MFLDKPVPEEPFPSANKGDDVAKGVIKVTRCRIVRWALDKLFLPGLAMAVATGGFVAYRSFRVRIHELSFLTTSRSPDECMWVCTNALGSIGYSHHATALNVIDERNQLHLPNCYFYFLSCMSFPFKQDLAMSVSTHGRADKIVQSLDKSSYVHQRSFHQHLRCTRRTTFKTDFHMWSQSYPPCPQSTSPTLAFLAHIHCCSSPALADQSASSS